MSELQDALNEQRAYYIGELERLGVEGYQSLKLAEMSTYELKSLYWSLGTK